MPAAGLQMDGRQGANEARARARSGSGNRQLVWAVRLDGPLVRDGDYDRRAAIGESPVRGLGETVELGGRVMARGCYPVADRGSDAGVTPAENRA